jgi:hypothetical protein
VLECIINSKVNKSKAQLESESRGTNLSNIRRQMKSKSYKFGDNLGRGSSINQIEKKGRKEVSVSRKKIENNAPYLKYKKMRVWKLDIVESLDLEKYLHDLKHKGKARTLLHPNREITYDLATEYNEVMEKNNFAMLVEYCGERNLDGKEWDRNNLQKLSSSSIRRVLKKN